MMDTITTSLNKIQCDQIELMRSHLELEKKVDTNIKDLTDQMRKLGMTSRDLTMGKRRDLTHESLKDRAIARAQQYRN